MRGSGGTTGEKIRKAKDIVKLIQSDEALTTRNQR